MPRKRRHGCRHGATARSCRLGRARHRPGRPGATVRTAPQGVGPGGLELRCDGQSRPCVCGLSALARHGPGEIGAPAASAGGPGAGPRAALGCKIRRIGPAQGRGVTAAGLYGTGRMRAARAVAWSWAGAAPGPACPASGMFRPGWRRRGSGSRGASSAPRARHRSVRNHGANAPAPQARLHTQANDAPLQHIAPFFITN